MKFLLLLFIFQVHPLSQCFPLGGITRHTLNWAFVDGDTGVSNKKSLWDYDVMVLISQLKVRVRVMGYIYLSRNSS